MINTPAPPTRPAGTGTSTRLDRYVVIGNPVAHSKSPLIHARFAEMTGQALSYERLLAPLDGFEAALQQLLGDGARGCNVTVPFKLEAFRAAATRSDRAELAQASNTLVLSGATVHADNTDGIGLVNDIQANAGIDLAGRDILLIGAGGAGAGALGPLIATRPRRLVVANRTPEKAEALVERHRAHASLKSALQGIELLACGLHNLPGSFDAVINASASSLAGAAIPIEAKALKPGALAYDMMYGNAAEPFMAWARAHGATPRDGLGMLVEQAAEAFLLWRGVRPPSRQVLDELRAQLT